MTAAARSSAGSARTAAPSVQAAIEEAVFALSGRAGSAGPQAPGRTDCTAVHAVSQVAHFDLANEKRLEEVRGALSFHLKPQPIVVRAAELAPPGFHARFSATYRRYRYRILNRRTPAALQRGQVWHVPVPLDAGAMQAAAAVLIGKHDFNSFRSASCQAKSSIKTLDELAVQRCGEEIRIEVGARSFLHNQVRILAGTLQLGGPRPVEQGRCRGGARRHRPHARRTDRAAARPLPDGSALRRFSRG
jgi:tRNA pseudouridine38-40 synthase